MSVRVEDGVIYLGGRCLPADAEALLVALQEGPAEVDLSGAQRLHLAIVQVLLAARPAVRGVPEGDFARDHLLNLLR